jgi:hypothetical protein
MGDMQRLASGQDCTAAAEIIGKAGAGMINSLRGNSMVQGLGGDDLLCGDVDNDKLGSASGTD